LALENYTARNFMILLKYQSEKDKIEDGLGTNVTEEN
jgi:hypothetical protein